MKGLEMMLKAFGMDPDAVKASIEKAVNEARETISRFDLRLTNIERGMSTINERLAKIEALINERKDDERSGSDADRRIEFDSQRNGEPVAGNGEHSRGRDSATGSDESPGGDLAGGRIADGHGYLIEPDVIR